MSDESKVRTWIGYVDSQSGESQSSEVVLISTYTGEYPTEGERKNFTLDWMGYDEDDGEDMWDDGESAWYTGDNLAIQPIRIRRELTPVEVMIWDIARALPYRSFSLDDFMKLAEADGDT